MTAEAVANVALVVALVSMVVAAAAVMMALYMLGEVRAVMRLWDCETDRRDSR